MPGPIWQQNTPTFSPEVMRLRQSAMCTPTRSWRTTIGRMPASAAVSVSGFSGYVSSTSTPSRLRISAVTWATFILASFWRALSETREPGSAGAGR